MPVVVGGACWATASQHAPLSSMNERIAIFLIFIHSMRNRQRTTERGVSRELLEIAARDVERGLSIRGVAKSYSISKTSLARYVQKRRDLKEAGKRELPDVGYARPGQVFSQVQERELRDYLLKAAAIFYGLSPKQVFHEVINNLNEYDHTL